MPPKNQVGIATIPPPPNTYRVTYLPYNLNKGKFDTSAFFQNFTDTGLTPKELKSFISGVESRIDKWRKEPCKPPKRTVLVGPAIIILPLLIFLTIIFSILRKRKPQTIAQASANVQKFVAEKTPFFQQRGLTPIFPTKNFPCWIEIWKGEPDVQPLIPQPQVVQPQPIMMMTMPQNQYQPMQPMPYSPQMSPDSTGPLLYNNVQNV